MILNDGWYKITYQGQEQNILYKITDDIIKLGYGNETIFKCLKMGWEFEPVHVISTVEYHELVSTRPSKTIDTSMIDAVNYILPILKRISDGKEELTHNIENNITALDSCGFDLSTVESSLMEWRSDTVRLDDAIWRLEKWIPEEIAASTEPLDPCPFCGFDALEPYQITLIEDEKDRWYLDCPGCETLKVGPFDSREELIDYWHYRIAWPDKIEDGSE